MSATPEQEQVIIRSSNVDLRLTSQGCPPYLVISLVKAEVGVVDGGLSMSMRFESEGSNLRKLIEALTNWRDRQSFKREYIWFEDKDDDGNTTWELTAPFMDDTFCWRLVQELHNNAIVWVSNDDDEVGDAGTVFNTLEEGKWRAERAYDRILEQSE